MKIIGIEKSKEKKDEPREIDLYETAIFASIEEIDELIEFFKYVKEDHARQRDVYKLSSTHNHFQDFKNGIKTDRSAPDIVVYTVFDEKSTEKE